MKILAKYKTSYDVSDSGQLEHVVRNRPKELDASVAMWRPPSLPPAYPSLAIVLCVVRRAPVTKTAKCSFSVRTIYLPRTVTCVSPHRARLAKEKKKKRHSYACAHINTHTHPHTHLSGHASVCPGCSGCLVSLSMFWNCTFWCLRSFRDSKDANCCKNQCARVHLPRNGVRSGILMMETVIVRTTCCASHRD